MPLGVMFTILTCLVSSCFLITSCLTACFKLTSCNPNTANQNMHAFGVMVIVRFLYQLLIIIYEYILKRLRFLSLSIRLCSLV